MVSIVDNVSHRLITIEGCDIIYNLKNGVIK